MRSGTNHWIRNTLRAATGSLLHDPFVRALNKQGVRVLSAYVDFQTKDGGKSIINERLLAAPCGEAVASG